MAFISTTAAATTAVRKVHRPKEKVVVIVMGATGTGKPRLSVDLATGFYGEVINSDKIQVYRGLDITTNKMPVEERLGVPHHLLGLFDSVSHGEYTPGQFGSHASHVESGIVGGSNSSIYALLDLEVRYNPDSYVFAKYSQKTNEPLKRNWGRCRREKKRRGVNSWNTYSSSFKK